MTTLSARPPLARSSDRVIAGVCSGLAVHLGWPVKNVRVGMVLASFAGGAGLVFYAWLWIMVPTADEAARRNARRPASPIAPTVSQSTVSQPMQGRATPGTADDGGTRAGAAGAVGSVPGDAGALAGPPWFRARGMRYGKEILLGCGLLLVAGIMIAQLLGVDVSLGTLIPAAAVLGGASIAWMQLDETRRAGLVDKTKADQAGGWGRLAAGLALVVAGVLVMVSGSGSWEQTWLALLASVAVLGGVVLVLLPWALKFWRDLEAERAGRIRETERAEIAAHLHDSVLQTLALIQRRAGNEHDVVRLARAQERELRGWLFQDPGPRKRPAFRPDQGCCRRGGGPAWQCRGGGHRW
ncbi:hypothetical protein GCM10007170_12700 [Arthrobacter liuii]|uniref:Phage shock protein PspC N-terminal domain-containing protein n=1 Tax=Arthrobacter liuii TaxID=1476996 RepID=A0ABQ2ANQ7_9MICC|nr:hypothetical protein GCM10007170_12700 [Arthrobacter liuii]